MWPGLGAMARRLADAARDIAAEPAVVPGRPQLLLDLYREEAEDGAGPLPEFDDLFAARLAAPPCRYLGIWVKATNGTRYDTRWLRRSWRRLRGVGGDEYGKTWFRGAYHYLRLKEPGEPQGRFYLDTIEAAGGWDLAGDMVPILDIEWGKNEGAKEKQVRAAVQGFVSVVEAATKRRVAIYGGRLVGGDLGIRDRFGLSRRPWIAASYTTSFGAKARAGYNRIGVPTADIFLDQYTDGKKRKPFITKTGVALPIAVPGVKHGDLDCSVQLEGDETTFLRRMVNVPA